MRAASSCGGEVEKKWPRAGGGSRREEAWRKWRRAASAEGSWEGEGGGSWVMTAAAEGVKRAASGWGGEVERRWPRVGGGSRREEAWRMWRRVGSVGRSWKSEGESLWVMMAAAGVVMRAASSWEGEVEKRWPEVGRGSRKEDAWRSGRTMAPWRAMRPAADEVEMVESGGAAAKSCFSHHSFLIWQVLLLWVGETSIYYPSGQT